MQILVSNVTPLSVVGKLLVIEKLTASHSGTKYLGNYEKKKKTHLLSEALHKSYKKYHTLMKHSNEIGNLPKKKKKLISKIITQNILKI